MKIVSLFITVLMAMTFPTEAAAGSKGLEAEGLNPSYKTCRTHSDCETIASTSSTNTKFKEWVRKHYAGQRVVVKEVKSYCLVDADKNGRCLFLDCLKHIVENSCKIFNL